MSNVKNIPTTIGVAFDGEWGQHNLNNKTMKNPFVNPNYFVWIYASDGNVYSIIPFEKKEDAYKRRDLLQVLSYTCSVERELPCEWTEIGVSIHV